MAERRLSKIQAVMPARSADGSHSPTRPRRCLARVSAPPPSSTPSRRPVISSTPRRSWRMPCPNGRPSGGPACAPARRSGRRPRPGRRCRMKANEAWVSDPSDPNRRKAMAAAEAVGFGHPAGATGMAVFTSGGSMAAARPAGGRPRRSPHAACRVLRRPVRRRPRHAGPPAEMHRKFLDLGLGVAEGRLVWPGAR